MTPDYLQLKQRFHQLCFSLTPLEWRLIRNPDYWLSDYMSPEQSLMHKYERVVYYKTNRTVKPYSPQMVQERHDEMERKNNKQKSILDSSKKKVTDEEADSDKPFV